MVIRKKELHMRKSLSLLKIVTMVQERQRSCKSEVLQLLRLKADFTQALDQHTPSGDSTTMAMTNNVFGEGSDKKITKFKMHAAKIMAF